MPVTLNILLDHLSPFNSVAYVKNNENPVFRGIRILSSDTDCASPDYLYACSFSQAVQTKQKYPDRYYLCPRDRLKKDIDDEVPAGIIFIDGNIDWQSLLIYNKIFSVINDWERSMQKSLLAQKGLQDLLNISESIMGSHIAVFDCSLNLLAQTRHLNSGNSHGPLATAMMAHDRRNHHKRYSYERCLKLWSQIPVMMIAKKDIEQKNIHAFKVLETDNGSFVLVLLTCNSLTMTRGLYDMLLLLLEKISYSVNSERWKQQLQ